MMLYLEFDLKRKPRRKNWVLILYYLVINSSFVCYTVPIIINNLKKFNVLLVSCYRHFQNIFYNKSTKVTVSMAPENCMKFVPYKQIQNSSEKPVTVMYLLSCEFKEM